MRYPPRILFTHPAIRPAASSISASVVVGPRLNRMADRCTSSGRPIAARTGNGRSDPLEHADQLLACARREEEIAERVESLFPGAAAIQRDMLAKNPDFLDISRKVFSGLPVLDQFRLQAQGERLGAATWRSLARQEESPVAREVYLACAELEQASALVLEAIL